MAKTMIFLFDGTANDATEDLFSNVYAINQLVAESGRGRRPQITFYLPGIGTKFTVRRVVDRKTLWNIFSRTDKVRQYIFGDNVEQIVLRAYVNLCANYRPGDCIAILGFSRGAIGARIFSRLISDFGILAAKNLMLLDRLWNEFVEVSNEESDVEYKNRCGLLKDEFKGTAGDHAFHPSADLPIRFLGCFDAVRGSADELLSQNVRFRDHVPASGVQHVIHLMSLHDARADFELMRFSPLPAGTDDKRVLREIWVPGVHSDVGGGYPENFISNIALLTMAKLLEKHAAVLLDKEATDSIEEQIGIKLKAGKFYVNPEPRVRSRASRLEKISDHDEIHPLHNFLVGKSVYFKTGDTSRYEDRVGNVCRTDPELERHFARWVRSRRGSKQAR